MFAKFFYGFWKTQSGLANTVNLLVGCENLFFFVAKITDQVTSLGRFDGNDFTFPTIVTSISTRVSVRFSSSGLDSGATFLLEYRALGKH